MHLFWYGFSSRKKRRLFSCLFDVDKWKIGIGIFVCAVVVHLNIYCYLWCINRIYTDRYLRNLVVRAPM